MCGYKLLDLENRSNDHMTCYIYTYRSQYYYKKYKKIEQVYIESFIYNPIEVESRYHVMIIFICKSLFIYVYSRD